MNVETYFRDRLRELESIASRGDPWIFLCASSFIEYLGKMAHGGPIGLKEYKEFLLSVSGTVGTDSTPEGNRSFAKACNTLHLIGTKGVIAAPHAYQDEIRISNPSHSALAHDALLSRLIWGIRKDVGIPGTPEASEFSVRLWCSGTNPKE